MKKVTYKLEFPKDSLQAKEWEKGNLRLIDEFTPYVVNNKTKQKYLKKSKKSKEK